MSDFNFNNLRVDDQGRTSFSGLGSGIDFQATVDQIIRAKRIPVDRIEARIENNQGKISSFREMGGLYDNFRSALDLLRGKITFGNAGNIFESKASFATSSLSGGSLFRPTALTASDFSNLVGITVDNNADIGSRTLEIVQTAESQRLSSSEFTTDTDPLAISGTFSVNGAEVTIDANMSLRDVRDAINNATYDDDGDPDTDPIKSGVQASIISASDTEHYLILTNEETGVEITFDDPDGLLRDMGILIGNSGTVTSNAFTDSFTPLAGVIGPGFTGGSVTVNGNVINILATDSLQDIANKLDAPGNVVALVNGSGGIDMATPGGGPIEIDDPNGVMSLLGFNVPAENGGNVTGTTQITDTAGELARQLSPWEGGSFSLNGEVFNIGVDDTLQDVVDAINANGNLGAANISASSLGGTLSITDADGDEITVVDISNGAAGDLGLFNQVPNNGSISGVSGINVSTSLQVSLSTFSPGDIYVNGVQFTFTDTDSLEDVRDAINASGDPALVNVTASISGSGELVLVDGTAADIELGDPDGLLGDLGIVATVETGIISGSDFAVSDVQMGGGLLSTYQGGDVTINGITVTINQYDSLEDIRDAINAAGAGVSASIIGGTSLQIDSVPPGSDINIGDPTNAFGQLGITASSGVADELQAAQNALYNLDGLSDDSRFQTDLVYNANETISTLTSGTISDGSFNITVDGTTLTINYTTGMTINDMVNEINLQANGSAIGRDIASVESFGSRGVRLVVDGDPDDVAINNDSNGANGFLTSFNFDNPLLLESASNTVVSNGITFNFFQAEPGTIIEVDVDRDRNSVKDAVVLLVDSYNEIINFMNQQGLAPESDEDLADTLVGPLFQDSTMRDLRQTISTMMAGAVDGANSEFNQLGLLGIEFASTNNGLLEIDETVLDDAIVDDFESVRKFFSFEAQTSLSSFTVLGFDGDMTRVPGGLDVNFETDVDGNLTSVDIGGDSSIVEIDGNKITITGGPAEGLVLNYAGGAVVGSQTMTVTYSVGLGAKLYEEVGRITESTTGTLDQRIAELNDVNKAEQRSADLILERLDLERDRLLNQFIRMETALAQFESLKSSLTQSFAALNNSGDN